MPTQRLPARQVLTPTDATSDSSSGRNCRAARLHRATDGTSMPVRAEARPDYTRTGCRANGFDATSGIAVFAISSPYSGLVLRPSRSATAS